MEDFNYELDDRNDGDALEPLQFNRENSFINRSEFTSTDVERVLMEAQENILNSIEPIGNCQDTNSFLNPISDILGDICEFTKNFGGNTHIGMCPSQASQHVGAANNSLNWSLTESTSAPYISSSNCTSMFIPADSIIQDSGFYNASTSDEVGQLPLSTEYPTPDSSLLNCDYVSSFNQLFQNFEQQQLLMSTPIAGAMYPLTQTAHNFSDTFLSTIGSLPASTTITPISGVERQIGHRSVSPNHQQGVTIETRFVSERGRNNLFENENFTHSYDNVSKPALPSQHFIPQNYDESVYKRNSSFNLEKVPLMAQTPAQQQHKIIAILNQNQYQPVGSTTPICGTVSNQNMCLLPQKTQLPTISTNIATSKLLQTPTNNRFNWSAVFPRKHFMHPPEMIIMHPLRTKKLMTNRRAASADTTIDLSEYFDTSSINIPMIPERPRSDTKKQNRRKQKLKIIPGAENLIFEIQKNEENESEVNLSSVGNENLQLEEDPYPETELPELEEIFKRKKKTTSLAPSGKRTNVTLPTVAAPQQKKQCLVNVATSQQQPAVQESSTSFEEKISLSIAIRQGRSKISMDRIDISSESDSAESDIGLTQGAKSLKCQKCMKLFKTTRSLAIHTKRCDAVAKKTYFIREIEADYLSNHEANSYLKDQAEEKTFKIELANLKGQEDMKNYKAINSDEMKARPITRSQTKRSTGRIIRPAMITKRSK